MPLSWLRRPAFLLLLPFMGLIAWREARGDFRLDVPKDEERRVLWRLAAVEGLAVSPLRESSRGRTVVLEARRLDGAAWERRVLVYLPPGAAPRPGTALRLSGVPRRPRGARNPGDYDERRHLERQGIGWIFAAHEVEELPAPVPWRWKPHHAAEGVRRSLTAALRRRLPGEEARLTTGLLLGSPGPLRPRLKKAVRDAGAVHLLVPSGTQVAFVMLGAAWAGRLLGLWVWARFALAAASGGFYALMTGAEPPQLRALAGGLAFYAGLLSGREAGAFQALVLSAWGGLLAEPRALFTAGFQMTYLASFALMAVLPRVDRALAGRPWWLKGAAQTAAATAAAQAVLWPVFACAFGRAAALGALSNLILVPLSGVIMAAGAGVLALSALGGGWWLAAASAATALPARLFMETCLFAASWPGAALEVSAMSGTAVCAYYLILVPLMAGFRRRAGAWCCAAALCAWAGGAAAEKIAAPPLRVVYLWPAAAGTALVSFDGKTHWLVGAGARAGVIVKAMRKYKIKRLDKIILTKATPVKGTALRKLTQWGYIRPNDIVPFEPGRSLRAICHKRVCAEFDPPRLKRGQAQFSIIAPSLRRAAVEAATDGSHVTIRGAAGQEIH